MSVGSTAERAVYDAFASYRALLAGAGEYLAGRVADLDDVRNRIVARLLGVPMPGVPDSDEPYVLIARDLAPADTALLDPTLVLGFVTEGGRADQPQRDPGRALGVPAVVALPGAGELAEGTVIAVDGSTGEIFVEPSAEKRAQLEAAAAERKASLSASTGPGATSDGHKGATAGERRWSRRCAGRRRGRGRGCRSVPHRVPLSGTTASRRRPRRAGRGVPAGAGGVPRGACRGAGAGRGRGQAAGVPLRPTSRTRHWAYGVCAPCSTTPMSCERSLRRSRRPRRGCRSYLEVMAPMVADRIDAKAFADACRAAGLQAKFGAMVEIPSAALRARSILQEVEFLSLGTNDLAQYTFAADRQVGAVSRLQDPWQPALLDLVAVSAEAAKAEGKSCGVCGEAASDPLLACADRSGGHLPVDGCRVHSLCPGDARQVHAGAVRACRRGGTCHGHGRRGAHGGPGGAVRRVAGTVRRAKVAEGRSTCGWGAPSRSVRVTCRLLSAAEVGWYAVVDA